MSRTKKHELRSALHNIEFSFRGDHSPQAELERDMIAVACCDLWANNTKKFVCRVRRLLGLGNSCRTKNYADIINLVAE